MQEKEKKKRLVIKADDFKTLTLAELKAQIALGVINPHDSKELFKLVHKCKLDVDAKAYVENVLGIPVYPDKCEEFILKEPPMGLSLKNLKDIPKIDKEEIDKAIDDEKWQEFRKSLKGISTEEKLDKLQEWLNSHKGSRKAEVQVINYINALKRGGQL